MFYITECFENDMPQSLQWTPLDGSHAEHLNTMTTRDYNDQD